MVPCNDNFFCSQTSSFVDHHAIQWILLHGLSNLVAVVPSFTRHQTTNQLFLFGHPCHEFLLVTLSSLVIRRRWQFFALLLLANMPKNVSVFFCATNLKAVSHQNNICLRLITDPNKVAVRLIAQLTSQLLFKIHFYQAFCLITYYQNPELLSCNKLHPCWLLVAFLKM